jgi:asparagine synthase (glutamine-hydrolysing)
MCGISGVVSVEISRRERMGAVERMCAAMIHRGPDDSGLRDFGVACIGMRRLSIIDCSVQGRQPMPDENHSKWVVLNGEIYNFQALRSELEARNHTFRSRADTEVIPHLYEELGVACCERLRGMFGLAVWDVDRQELLLARDRLGIKPLYYAEVPGGWAFASEVGALLESGLIEAELDPVALDLYLTFGYTQPPRTLVKGISALPPGHRAVIGGGRIVVERWWDFPQPGSLSLKEQDIIPHLRALLEDTVRLHQISDVPIGAFLSGGVDSTAVVGLMSRLLDEPVRTFSVGFDAAPQGLDERTPAREAARAFGTAHTEVVVGGRDVREQLPRIVEHLDQPSFDGVNTYLVSRAAKRGGLTVALSGLGGDEVFGGYRTFGIVPRWERASRLWARLPSSLRRAIMAPVARGAALTGKRSVQTIRRMQWVDSPEALFGLARFTLWPEEQAPLYSPGFSEHLRAKNDHNGAAEVLRSLVRPGDRPWRMVSLLEMQAYMGWRLLRDTDAMSMAHSLEVRVPLVDHELVEFVCGLPAGWERRRGYPKRLLTSALADVLPATTVSRKKQGFALPMATWMENELREVVADALAPHSVRSRGLFSPDEISRLYQGFRDGIYDHSVVWQLVILELWMREVLDKPRLSRPAPASVSETASMQIEADGSAH